jgi:uncharacterized protein (TIGR02996 family)
MPHAQLVAFLHAIKDQPHDDCPRLVLADWLEEHGQTDSEPARACFIRLQCQLARPGPRDSAWREAKAQARALRRAHLAPWLGCWQPWMIRPDLEESWFERGLLRPCVTGGRWLEKVGQEPAAWAWVDGLTLLDPSPPELERLMASPVLQQLNYLHFGPDGWPRGEGIAFGPLGARLLASSPHLTRPTSLEFTDAVLGPEGARALAASPNLRQLRSLDLSGSDSQPGNGIGDAGLQALAGSVYMANLAHLDLRENGITAEGARALSESPHLCGLAVLNLRRNPIGPAGARALASSPFLARLTALGVELTADRTYSSGWWERGPDIRDAADVQRELDEARAALRRRFGERVHC